MPFTNNDGIKIHYVVEGAGPPLVLHHGTFGSWEHWQDFGYLDDLKRDHKLIMVDARGHGASDKPHAAAAYDLPQRVRDVTSVLDELGIAQANYFGFSLGGWIGFGLAKYAPSRLRSLIVGGAHPFEENMQPFRDLIPQDADAFFALIGPAFGMHMTPAIKARLLSCDLKALQVLTQDRTSMADILPTMTMPCFLFVGEADPRRPKVLECSRRLPGAEYLMVPASDHMGAFARSDVVVPRVRAFLKGP